MYSFVQITKHKNTLNPECSYILSQKRLTSSLIVIRQGVKRLDSLVVKQLEFTIKHTLWERRQRTQAGDETQKYTPVLESK